MWVLQKHPVGTHTIRWVPGITSRGTLWITSKVGGCPGKTSCLERPTPLLSAFTCSSFKYIAHVCYHNVL